MVLPPSGPFLLCALPLRGSLRVSAREGSHTSTCVGDSACDDFIEGSREGLSSRVGVPPHQGGILHSEAAFRGKGITLDFRRRGVQGGGLVIPLEAQYRRY